MLDDRPREGFDIALGHGDEQSSYANELDRQRGWLDLDAPLMPTNVEIHSRFDARLFPDAFGMTKRPAESMVVRMALILPLERYAAGWPRSVKEPPRCVAGRSGFC